MCEIFLGKSSALRVDLIKETLLLGMLYESTSTSICKLLSVNLDVGYGTIKREEILFSFEIKYFLLSFLSCI